MVTAAKDEHWKYLRTVLAPSYSSKRMREVSMYLNFPLNDILLYGGTGLVSYDN